MPSDPLPEMTDYNVLESMSLEAMAPKIQQSARVARGIMDRHPEVGSVSITIGGSFVVAASVTLTYPRH